MDAYVGDKYRVFERDYGLEVDVSVQHHIAGPTKEQGNFLPRSYRES